MAKTAPVDKKISGTEPLGFADWLRRFGVVVLAVVGCVALSAYVVVYWAEKQILTTDNWVQLVAPLPQQPVVSTALAGYITDRVFSQAEVEDRVAAVLPTQASFLADPLATQIKTRTTNAAQRLVASNAFLTIWESANRLAMGRLLAKARGQPPPLQARVSERFNLDLSGSAGQLRQALGTVSSAIPALQPATQKAITLSVDLHERPRRLQQAVKSTDFLAAVLPLLIIASLLWSLAWSHNRRRTAIWLALGIIGLLLVELIGIKALRQQVLDLVQNPANLSAVSYVFDMLVGWLRRMIYVVAIIAAAVFLLLLAGGPAGWAQRLRRMLQVGRLTTSGLAQQWRRARAWLASREYYVWLGVGGLVLLGTAFFAAGNIRTIVNALLLMLGLFALVHWLATPRQVASQT